eukprot:8152781-Lingulodinium_polyedra.AAC.1
MPMQGGRRISAPAAERYAAALLSPRTSRREHGFSSPTVPRATLRAPGLKQIAWSPSMGGTGPSWGT